MVSLRCKMKVISELNALSIAFKSVELGEVLLVEPISKEKRQNLLTALHFSGLDLMDDRKAIMIEGIINIIVNMVHYTPEAPKINFSAFLQEKMNLDYNKMAEIFSKTKGITIEHFIILHKVERIKELITYDKLSLTEISDKLHYSSLSHLSKQFKQVTGFTPTFFKSLSTRKRINLEDL